MANGLVKGLIALVDRTGLDKYSQQALKRRFPSYVGEFERRYGPFSNHPELVFEPLGLGLGKVVGDYRIALNSKPPFVTMVLGREDTIKHKLGHLVFLEIARQVNPSWFDFENGQLYVNKDMLPQGITIHEGCADYLSVQNGAKGGPGFVNPVLNKLGVKDGITKLLLDPPTKEELKDAKSYYLRLGLSN